MSNLFNSGANTELREYQSQLRKQKFRHAMVLLGILLFIAGSVLLIVLPTLTTPRIVGIVTFYILGFACCIAGTDNENKEF